MSFHARLIAAVSLGVAALTSLAMLGILMVVQEESGSTYAETIGAFVASRENLTRATLISGLTLITLAGWLTWFIALFSSFRIAGPLYRLCRNLEAVNRGEPSRMIGLRHGDYLQESLHELERSVERLRQHRQEIAATAERLSRTLSRTDLFSREVGAAMIVDLQRLRRAVRI